MSSPIRATLVLGLALGLLLAVQACRSSPPPDYSSLAGAENEALLSALRSAIADESRRERVEAQLEAYMAEEEQYFQFVLEARARVVELDAAHDSPRFEFERVLDEIGVRRRVAARSAAQTFAAVRRELSREEWGEVWGAVRTFDQRWEELRP